MKQTFSVVLIIAVLSIIGYCILYKIAISDQRHEIPKDYVYNSADSVITSINVKNIVTHVVPEGKSLGFQFLTLIVGILVASITFSEKIVQFSTATAWAKAMIISSWICLLGALVMCGIAISFLMLSEAYAIYQAEVNRLFYRRNFLGPFMDQPYNYWALRSAIMFATSGFIFSSGIITLVISAIISGKSKSVHN